MPRLIDADALRYELTVETVKCARMSEETKWTMAERVLNRLDEAPTLDHAQLVPQGEWIDKPTGAYGRWQSWCSVCGKHSGIGGIESNRHKPYCPNCGARMKGEKR